MSGDNESKQWHLSRTVNVSHLLTTLALAGSVMTWAASVDKRVTVVETQIEHQVQRDREIQHQVERSGEKINQKLDKVDSKLDKLIERELDRNGR